MTNILTVEQTAQMLQFSPRMVRYYLQHGMIPGRKVGRCWQVDQKELDELFRAGAREARDRWAAKD